jgi:hypothetical protein
MFTPRPGSKLEKDQEEWMEESKDKLEEDKMEDEMEDQMEEDVVGTLLFVGGEHGVVEREPAG